MDQLVGLKENVIVGRLIPAGTGHVMNNVRISAARRDNELAAEAAKRLADQEGVEEESIQEASAAE